MSKVDRFWSHEAQNIRCVRESDYDRDIQELNDENEKFAEALEVAAGKSIAERNALRAQVEALHSVLEQVQHELQKGRVWNGMGWTYIGLHMVYQTRAMSIVEDALAGQQQQGEPHNCDLEGGHLPIGWGGLVFCELCSARLPDEPALAEAEQPVIYPEDDPDERAGLSTALFNALESYEASRGKFSRKDQKIHAKQCELIRQHAAQLLAGQPAAVDEREAFEAWADSAGCGKSFRESMYMAWQARAALAPAAVVMPERMTTIPEGKTISYAAGYEAALDAVANLNRNTVSLELLERIPHEWNCGTLGGLRRAIDELHAILGANCGSIDDLTHDSEEPSHDR